MQTNLRPGLHEDISLAQRLSFPSARFRRRRSLNSLPDSTLAALQTAVNESVKVPHCSPILSTTSEAQPSVKSQALRCRSGGHGPSPPYFNPMVYTPVTAVRFGTIKRSTLRGSGYLRYPSGSRGVSRERGNADVGPAQAGRRQEESDRT